MGRDGHANKVNAGPDQAHAHLFTHTHPLHTPPMHIHTHTSTSPHTPLPTHTPPSSPPHLSTHPSHTSHTPTPHTPTPLHTHIPIHTHSQAPPHTPIPLPRTPPTHTRTGPTLPRQTPACRAAPQAKALAKQWQGCTGRPGSAHTAGSLARGKSRLVRIKAQFQLPPATVMRAKAALDGEGGRGSLFCLAFAKLPALPWETRGWGQASGERSGQSIRNQPLPPGPHMTPGHRSQGLIPGTAGPAVLLKSDHCKWGI